MEGRKLIFSVRDQQLQFRSCLRGKCRTNVTVAGSADAEVGEVGGQAARAVGRAEQREGHGVVRVKRGGQWRRELDVGQVGK